MEEQQQQPKSLRLLLGLCCGWCLPLCNGTKRQNNNQAHSSDTSQEKLKGTNYKGQREPNSQFFFFVFVFFNMFADFRFLVQAQILAENRMKPQIFAENRTETQNFAETRLSHLVCPF